MQLRQVDEVGVRCRILFSFFFFLEKIRIDRNNRAAAGRRIKKDDTARANARNPCAGIDFN